MKPETFLYRLALVVMLATSLTMAFRSSARAAGMQEAGGAGPSFPCEKATTSVEKLICSDRNLSALDLEYSRLYGQRLQESDKPEAEEIRSRAKSSLQTRDNCANDRVDAASLKASELECLASWYYGRIAELSEMPSPAPAEWSPRFVAAVEIYIHPLWRMRDQKPVPEVYVRDPGADRFLKMSVEYGAAQPANLDRSVSFYVYRNVAGSLTYVAEYRNLQAGPRYFFSKDGRLAAVGRRFGTRLPNGDPYVESETVFYDAAGRETLRTLLAYEKGKITEPVKALSPPRLEKPSFNTFAAFFDARFKTANNPDPNQLGLCYLDLADGYGSFARILNIPAQPLDFYKNSIPPMNYSGLDDIWAKRSPASGVAQDLGTLDGKRVYSVNYPGDLHALLVERQAGRFLPVMYFSPFTKIDRLEIVKSGDRQVLGYSSRISGSGGQIDEWYFILDRGIPKSVKYRPAVEAELKKILPEHWDTRGGNFELRTLTFSSPIWKEEDARCCPTGGSVKVELGIKDSGFIVKSSRVEKSN